MAVLYTIPFAAERLTLEDVGGKGLSLSRLAQFRLPVPGGFFVTTAAYKQFIATNQFQERILSALSKVDPVHTASLDEASITIQTMLLSGQVPDNIRDAIQDAYRCLGDQKAVAVRSSATAEDLPGLSFAGQQDTYLNVTGCEKVQAAVKRCWASLWTARAIGYRLKHQINQVAVSLAVIVQELVTAEAAGVLFTADPLTGRRDHMVINAAWGLGNTVVGGLVTPDSIRVEKQKDTILLRQTAEKTIMTICTPCGTEDKAVPEVMKNAPVLDDNQAIQLAHLGTKIEQIYGGPMDIEWALADNRFYILQARPITALPEPAIAGWTLPNPKGRYIRMSITELAPDPLSPLFATLGLPAVMDGITKVLGELIRLPPDSLPEDWILTINGYFYESVTFTPKQWLRMLTMTLRSFEMIRTGMIYWKEVALPRYIQIANCWKEKQVEHLSARELVMGANELLEAFALHLAALMTSTMGPSAGSEALFTMVYEKLIKRPDDPSAPTFLMGFENTPLLADKGLYDLALWCREQPALADFLTGATVEQIQAQMATRLYPENVSNETWEVWLSRFNDHLEHFGHSIYDIDFSKPLPIDNPAPLLEALKLFIGDESKNPYNRQQIYAEQRENAVQEMRKRLKGVKRWAFEKALHWAQSQAPLRENGIAAIGIGYPNLRKILYELGVRLSRTGMIERPEDIYWLEYAELEAAAAVLDEGSAIPDRWLAIEERKALWRAQKKLTPLPSLPPNKKYLGMDVDKIAAFRVTDEQGQIIHGIGTSPGRVTATACVIHGPEEFSQLHQGDVLVAAITTPAWTPLFSLASAVVTDIGGPLSHGSIVAREYGIPAVLGTGNATKRIHSGEKITVDGSAGKVIMENGKKVSHCAACCRSCLDFDNIATNSRRPALPRACQSCR